MDFDFALLPKMLPLSLMTTLFFVTSLFIVLLPLLTLQLGSPSTLSIVEVTAFLLSAVVYIRNISKNPVIELMTGISEIGVSYAHSLSTRIMELISSLDGVSGIEGALDASTKTVFSSTPAISHMRSLNSSSVEMLILLYNLSCLCKNFS